jgi:peptidoglycan hydrolase CwlO-like protein
VKTRSMTEDRGETQTMLLEGMQGKIKETDRKLNLVESAMADLEEKANEIKDHIRERQQEINEMKRTIEEKANKGQILQ